MHWLPLVAACSARLFVPLPPALRPRTLADSYDGTNANSLSFGGEVREGAAKRVHAPPVLLDPGTVDAPGWVLPLCSVLAAGIPLLILTLARIGSGASANSARVLTGPPEAFMEPAPTPLQHDGIGSRHPEWLQILPTRLKGNGLFSCAPIARGSFLFDYEGERIDEAEYRRRYPDRVSDYAVGVKKNGVITFIDGVDPALSGVARYMNHSAARPNVKMQTDLVSEPPRVLMYAIKDIEPGDELVWNYGIGYVQAHPNLVEDTVNRPAVKRPAVDRPAVDQSLSPRPRAA
jgi:hypothetical protein